MEVKAEEYVRQVNFVAMVTLIANGVLSLAKLLVGIIAGSAALVSDAFHSMSDCFSTIVVIIGVKLSAKKYDKDHPYGHERLECVAALILSAMLLATAIIIGYNGVLQIIAIAKGEEGSAPGVLALVVAALSVVVKGWMYFYTERKAKALQSSSLHGDAIHHLSDSLSSIGAIIGIVGAMCGVQVLDAVAALFIALMIIKAAFDICRQAIDQMVDHSADEKTEQDISSAVLQTEGVERIDVLRTRMYANKVFVDLEIAVDPTLSLVEAHRIAENVHEKVEHGLGDRVKHCMVHVNPDTEADNHELPENEMEE